jgi:hypothetical protein
MKNRIPPKELREIWAKVPKMVDCKGKCAMSCGPIPVSSMERSLVEERAGHRLTTMDNPGVKNTDGLMICNMLTSAGLCSVYSIRPTICRVWGVTKSLACPLGCQPERWLTDREVLDLFAEVEALAGDHEHQAVNEMLAGMTQMERGLWRKSRDQMIEKIKERVSGHS